MHSRARLRGALDRFDRVATPNRILIASWLLFMVYGFPGYMSYDSVTQLAQARNLEPMNEWHPPLMAFIWHYLDKIIAGPVLMLVLQGVVFLLGTFALLRRVMSDRSAALVAAVFLLIPQNLVVLAVIWKDSQMAAYLVAGVAALLATDRRWRLVGCVLIFAATGVRYNAPAATLPIIVLLFQWRPQTAGWRRYAISTAVWIAVTAAAFGANACLVEKKLYPFQTATAMTDIAGTLRFAEGLTNEEALRLTPGVPWTSTDDIPHLVRKTYRPINVFLDLTQPPRQVFEYPHSQAHRDAFERAWKRVIAAYPKAFMWHRWRMFMIQLRPGGGIYALFSNADWGEDLLKHSAGFSRAQEVLVPALDKVSFTRLFRVFIYLVIAFALLPLCRGQRVAFALVTSGIAHELALYIVAPAADYRYSHWMICATMLGGILVFLARLRRARPTRVVSGEKLG